MSMILGRSSDSSDGLAGRAAQHADARPHRHRDNGAVTSTARTSQRARAAREAVTLPAITYPAELPVSARREDIAHVIAQHQVVMVAGETGSGKTTQLPKIALELGRGRVGQIGHTQPRRIAARSVAERIAEELGTNLGDIVGYQVRFIDESNDHTLVKVMTDGILLAQIQRDPDLLAYDTLIIDEAHERSLNIDVLLGYLTRLLPRRPDLKVIITSATIDTERFARHFAPGGPAAPDDADAQLAPVVEVTGRTYPVEVRYRPLSSDSKDDDLDLSSGIVAACDELMAEGPGDILVFLSGEREIRDAADALAGHLGPRVRDAKHPRAVELLPLYSRLSAAEQHRVFERHSTRRIVLATNVAETSLTVPGIHYVVDPGTARISRYSKATKVQRLPIEPVSQASANQRAGRAGRLADGIAIRLYDKEDYEGRPAFTEPEILRTSLASVLLQMISAGVVSSADDVASFPFIEPPDTRAIRDGLQLLADLGAVRQKGGRTQLTEVGRKIARLPIDPRQARMIIEGAKRGVAYEAMIIAAALSIQDIRERPQERRDEADLLHRRFATPTSDLLAYLNLWSYLRSLQKELSGTAFRKRVRAEFIHYLRMREWQDLVQQLRQAAKQIGISVKPRRPDAIEGEGTSIHHVWDEEAVHRAVLAGLLTQIGQQEALEVRASDFTHLRGEARQAALRKARKRSSNEYLGTRGARFAIQPSSPLSKKPPEFVMAAELVETNRLWARGVARIDPAWVEELAGDVAKRQYAEPRWSASKGAAVATERVTLYGVPIVTDRQVLWGRINREEARDLFIRHALVHGEWRTHHAFWKTNQRALAEAEELQARQRTPGLVATEDELFDFYDERIPEHVISTNHFDRWWKEARRTDPDLLTLTREDVLPDAPTVDPSLFPDTWPQGDLRLPLTYQFEPGADADGITVHIPLAVLPRVVPDGFDWLVPGLLHDLTTATIKALPKPVRRLLVPAPDAARDIAAWLTANGPTWEERALSGEDSEPYREAFARAARHLRDVTIPADAWDGVDDRLPSHVRITFRAVEYVGKRERTIDESTSLLALQHALAPQSKAAVRRAVTSATSPKQADAAPTPASIAAARAGGLHEEANLSSWPSAPAARELDAVIETNLGGGVLVRGYPAIVEEGDGIKASAALRILPSEHGRDAAHAHGVTRLLALDAGLQVKRITTRWSGHEALVLASSSYPSTEALVADLQVAAVRSLVTDAAHIRDADAYSAAREKVRTGLENAVYEYVTALLPVLETARALDAHVRASTSMALLQTLSQIRTQVAALIGPGFISRTPPERLRHLVRYVKAASARLDKAAENPGRDAELAWRVADVESPYESAMAAAAVGRPDAERDTALDAIRWMIEEYRVSLFAQHLGTDGPISDKRIRTALAAIAH